MKMIEPPLPNTTIKLTMLLLFKIYLPLHSKTIKTIKDYFKANNFKDVIEDNFRESRTLVGDGPGLSQTIKGAVKYSLISQDMYCQIVSNITIHVLLNNPHLYLWVVKKLFSFIWKNLNIFYAIHKFVFLLFETHSHYWIKVSIINLNRRY